MLLGIQEVSIGALIRPDWLATEMRAQINYPRVASYAELLAEGQDLGEPIVFIEPPSELMWAGDGFHRILAHEMNGSKVVLVDVRRGTRRDAKFFNIQENKRQGLGLPFQKGDFRKAITFFLKDSETSNWSASRIASAVGCSKGYVMIVVKEEGIERPNLIQDTLGRPFPSHAVKDHNSKALHDRRELARRRAVAAHSLRNQGLTHREIAAKVGCTETTVADYLKNPPASFAVCPRCHGSGKVSSEELESSEQEV